MSTINIDNATDHKVNEYCLKSFYDMDTRLRIMDRDMMHFQDAFKKLDSTMEKIGEVISRLSQMITLHEERLETQFNEDGANKIQIEKNRTERIASIGEIEKNIHPRITGVENKLEEFQKTILNTVSIQKEDTDKRIKSLELWRALIIGGALIVSALFGAIGQSIFDNLIPHKAPTAISQPAVK